MDTSMTALTKSIEKIGKAFEEFKTTNDERIAALESGNESKAGELGAKVAKIEAEISQWSAVKKSIELAHQQHQERMEELEARASSPGKTAEQKAKDEQKALFIDWMRHKGQAPHIEQQLIDLQRKDVTIGSPAGGGVAVPEEVARDIDQMQAKVSPVRRLVKVVKANSSDYKELVGIRGATSGWVGETAVRAATATPQLREVTPTHGELYAYPQCSEWALDDIYFNVEEWIAENVGEEFALQEGDAVIRGNGVSKPTGMLNTAPTAVADQFPPSRAAAVYQFIPNIHASFQIQGDSLINAVYTLNSAYRPGSVWTMNSLTTGAVRTIKDTTGQYLWAPGLVAGQPDRLLGYPVETWEQMDNPGANAHPIAFGNFRRAYVLVDRVGLRITRDNVTNVGFVRFYIRRREGGHVLNNDALKFIKTTAA